MRSFPDIQGQLTPQTLVQSLLNFKPIQEFIAVLANCKNEDDPIQK